MMARMKVLTRRLDGKFVAKQHLPKQFRNKGEVK